MATKKSMWVLFGILVISAWAFGSAVQPGAETMNCKGIATATKDERIPVSDEEGHGLGPQIMEGLVFCENREMAKVRMHSVFDFAPKTGAQAIGYNILTFDDGSTIVVRFQRLMITDPSGSVSAKATSEIIKGTGRFEGIKGTISTTGKNFPPSKGEAARVFNDSTWTYTLPSK